MLVLSLSQTPCINSWLPYTFTSEKFVVAAAEILYLLISSQEADASKAYNCWIFFSRSTSSSAIGNIE